MKTLLKLSLLFYSVTLFGQSSKTINTSKNNSWNTVSQVKKTIKNVHFTFPDHGFAYKHKNELVTECFEAMKYNSDLIKLNNFKDTIFIRFLPNRKAMLPLTGSTPSGSALRYIKTFYAVANENMKPPIKHELMHLIAMIEWGYEHSTSVWMNEGVATYASNNCSGWTVAEMYRYFLETDQLIPIELLTSDFRGQPENFAYHQSGYLVEYLLNHYSIDQFSKVWKDGFKKFEEVYGLPFSQIKADLEKDLITKMPKAPKIDPQTFYQDCE